MGEEVKISVPDKGVNIGSRGGVYIGNLYEKTDYDKVLKKID